MEKEGPCNFCGTFRRPHCDITIPESGLEKIRALQRQLALSELKVAEALEIVKGLENNLAIAIKVLKDLSSDYGEGSNGHNLIWDTIEGM